MFRSRSTRGVLAPIRAWVEEGWWEVFPALGFGLGPFECPPRGLRVSQPRALAPGHVRGFQPMVLLPWRHMRGGEEKEPTCEPPRLGLNCCRTCRPRSSDRGRLVSNVFVT